MLEIQARAKINWTLDAVGKRPDGYHELDMLMQSVSLCDTLTMRPAQELTLTLEHGARVPDDGNNLVLRAARALQEAAQIHAGAQITLRKRIPVAAGMGGGSADAAATLKGLTQLWGLPFTDAQLEEIGLTIGADVPFCIRGGLARARGVGELLESHTPGRQLWLVGIQPCRGLSTREVFGAFRWDEVPEADHPQTEAALSALEQGDVHALCRNLGNVLERGARAQRPEIEQAIEALCDAGALGAQMTGSGSAVFGVFARAKECRAAHAKLRNQYRVCRMMSTQDEGVVITKME